MADKTETIFPYDPSVNYSVKFVRPVSYRGATLDALNTHEMSGSVLAIILEMEGQEVVDRAEPR